MDLGRKKILTIIKKPEFPSIWSW